MFFGMNRIYLLNTNRQRQFLQCLAACLLSIPWSMQAHAKEQNYTKYAQERISKLASFIISQSKNYLIEKSIQKITGYPQQKPRASTCSMVGTKEYYSDTTDYYNDTSSAVTSWATDSITTDVCTTETTTSAGQYDTPEPVSWDEYYEEQAREEEEQKLQDEENAAAAEDHARSAEIDRKETLQRQAEEQKKEEQAALLAKHGYTFAPSEKTTQLLQAVQQDIQKNAQSNMSLASAYKACMGLFFVDEKKEAENNLKAQIEKEKEAWEQAALKEIEDKLAAEKIAASQGGIEVLAKSNNPGNAGPSHGNSTPSNSSSGNAGKKKPHNNHHDDDKDPHHVIKDVWINGQKYEQHIHIDPKTNCITSNYAISHNNPNDVHVFAAANLNNSSNTGLNSLHNLLTDHEQFRSSSKIHATKNSAQAQIQNISNQYLQGNLTAEQAYALEQPFHKQIEQAQFMQDNAAHIKAEQNALKEKLAQDYEKQQVEDKEKELLPVHTASGGEHQSFPDHGKPSSGNIGTPGVTTPPAQSPDPENYLDDSQDMYATSYHDTHEQTDAQTLHDQIIAGQEAWLQKKDFSATSCDDRQRIQDLLDIVAETDNPLLIEIAQASLRSWEQAQKATSDEERDYYREQSKKQYDLAHVKNPPSWTPPSTAPVNPETYDDLHKEYQGLIETNADNRFEKLDTHNSAHADRVEKRAQALIESRKQIENKEKLPQQSYSVSPQALDYMMANNMNHTAFNGGAVTNYQHCLTKEILGIVESSARIAASHDSCSDIGQIAAHNCNLAIAAQQLNQSERIQEATAVTDLSHLFDAYAQSLVNSGVHSQIISDVSCGIIDGTVQSLQNWAHFTHELCTQPSATLGKIADDCQNLGTCLYRIAEKAAEFSPFAYLEDMNQGMRDTITILHNHDNPTEKPQPYTNAMAERTARNAESIKNGLYDAVQAAQVIVDDMLNTSLRKNVANGTEIIVDNFITGKVAESLLHLSQVVGNKALQAAVDIKSSIPPHLQDAIPQFVQTNTGEIIAIAESTGENIGAAVAAKKVSDKAEQIIKNAAKAKDLKDKINELTKPDQNKIDAFQKSIDPYLNSEKIINVERLQSIEGIDQIENFRKYTNNFQNLEILTPEEVLYLNLCDWLEPQATKINSQLQAQGGIKIIDPITKSEIIIEQYDLFHSLLGEMKPNALANRTSGGHLMIPELRSATLDTRFIEKFGNGFLDIEIKYAGKIYENYKLNSYFPKGTGVDQSVKMIEDAILNFKEIEPLENSVNSFQKAFVIKNIENEAFIVRIENNIATFYPYKI